MSLDEEAIRQLCRELHGMRFDEYFEKFELMTSKNSKRRFPTSIFAIFVRENDFERCLSRNMSN